MERLTEILASDHLNVPNDDMVFEAALLWLDKCATRKQCFDKVSHLRCSEVSAYYGQATPMRAHSAFLLRA